MHTQKLTHVMYISNVAMMLHVCVSTVGQAHITVCGHLYQLSTSTEMVNHTHNTTDLLALFGERMESVGYLPSS